MSLIEAVFILAFICIRALCARLRRCRGDASRWRPTALSLASALVFFILSTVVFCNQVVGNVGDYVDDWDPTVDGVTNTPSDELDNICGLIVVFLADGLLVSVIKVCWSY
jgi:hypothetical protein